MYLKKIIISGFKSFADKIVVSLDKGITGVVGPNGSGKSNIIDSVRWVMGEQNAKNLRGEKATDIIFAGSEKRKPLGMAEVSIVFDNTDDNGFCPPEYRHEPEITLTRRLYADGQREYLINKKQCRLKDIVGFFATTGLGGRSYSMIQQGQVDRILNAKPEDVREIIEEAAGTLVYKKRKGEAQKKLEQTTLNLSRIEDILLEVGKQLESLGGQVEKAKEFQDLADKLRDEEVSLFAHNYKHFSEQRISIDAALEGEKGKEAESLAQISSLEVRHQDLQSQLDESDPDIQALQEQISIIREKIARSESLLKSSADRLAQGDRRLHDLAQELAEEDSNLKVLELQVDTSRQEMSQAEDAARRLSEAIEGFENEVESATEAAQVYQSRMDEFEDEIRNLERLVESNKFRSEQLDKDFSRCHQQITHEAERRSALTADLESAETELNHWEGKAGATKAGLDQEIREKHDREAAVAQRYRDIKTANVERDRVRERYHEARARFTSLQELEAGATDVAGALAKLRTEAPDIAGRLGGLLTDHLTFSHEAGELPRPAASAFERWAERVVIENLDAFNDLVRSAHRLNLGTLPVCLLSHAEAIDREAARRWADSCGAESMQRFLKVESASIAASGLADLMDRLYVLPTLSVDSYSLKQLPHGLVVFTSQGVTITGAGELVVGGKAQGGLLSRKSELETLAKELKDLEAELARTQATIDELEFKINEDRQVVAEIDAKLQAQNQGVLEVMTQLQAAQQLYVRKKELIEETLAATQKLEEQADRLTSERDTLVQNRAALDRELSNARFELENIEGESESLIERREEIRRLHDGKRLELAKSQARAQALRDGFATTRAQMELLQNKLSRRYEERSRIEQDLTNAQWEQDQAKQDIELFVRERERLQTEFSDKREENAGVIEETRVIESRLKALRDQISGMQKGLAEKNLQMERIRLALAGVTEQAIEKYKLDLSTFEFKVDRDFNHEARQRSVSRLRNRIEAMGAINMMAVREYEERNERRDFISRQRDEVLSSIDLLNAAIGEIEETSLRKFIDAFERINQEFGELFPILFPTGEGRLELTHPDNPLISGVEIMCRLPGKSKKPMTLFSGGEKALCAISLIFALLKTKPTPYCFLDEVDAPLDEANVGRYNRVLEALSSQFQFIVITHNRRTMEVLDTLYGITMQEPGVSKVVGVDMQKDLPSHLKKAFKDEKPAGASAPPPKRIEGATAGRASPEI
jgi:chromosome segregation protein